MAKSSVERVRETLAGLGLAADIREFDASTRTSAEAAAAIGCSLAQIAKSLVFRGRTTGQAILVIASGVNRVDVGKVERLIGETVEKADAAFVRAETGFAIGGVAPIGHGGRVRVLIDEDLAQFDEIWTAAGSPNAVFPLSPADLQRITQGAAVDLKE